MLYILQENTYHYRRRSRRNGYWMTPFISPKKNSRLLKDGNNIDTDTIGFFKKMKWLVATKSK